MNIKVIKWINYYFIILYFYQFNAILFIMFHIEINSLLNIFVTKMYFKII